MRRMLFASVAAVGLVALATVVAPSATAAPSTAAPSTASESTAAAAGALSVPPPPAPGKCGPYYTIDTSGGHASVRECRIGSTQIQVNGSVKDTAADGQCAQVYASYDVYRYTDYGPRACPQGEVIYFYLPQRSGTNAYIYLREVDA